VAQKPDKAEFRCATALTAAVLYVLFKRARRVSLKVKGGRRRLPRLFVPICALSSGAKPLLKSARLD